MAGKRTQRVTATDIAHGRIRIPRESKGLFPAERTDIEVRLRGKQVAARWDPRLGPPERSGTIGIGRELLATVVNPDEVLRIQSDGSTVVVE